MGGHYFNDMTPIEFAEHVKEFFPELLISMLKKLFNSSQQCISVKNISYVDHQTSYMSRYSAYEDESCWEDIEQLTLDEALARSLQLEDDFNDSDVTGHLSGSGLSDYAVAKLMNLSGNENSP
ncbi:unnamed protein product [Fraxinus pennsylvanica]|uniref:Uncharacterized protein n=1 Tax=Fraxinus pennsylvanica TaxID=56036 RepID=A0AAD2E1Z8_9LAMI|nr:unnamed protein product [Fraxinus pennsylvanica]